MKLTNKQRVLRRWPKSAFCAGCYGIHKVWNPLRSSKLIGYGTTAHSAWASAARNLTRAIL